MAFATNVQDVTMPCMALGTTTESTTEGGFLAALAAGLPWHGFWSAPVVVGVSGGADSVALLLGLHTLAAQALPGGRLIVAHARHDLREAAAADAAFVVNLAAGLRIPCEVRDVRVREPDGVRGEGIEGRARRLRRACFVDIVREYGGRCVVVAHTADDQVETILHRSLRGTGLAGLAGMATASELCDGVALLRPLLAVPRFVVREFLTLRGQLWREDATNADIRFSRNFLRHEILPRCESGPYPAATASLIRLASQAAAVATAVRSAAEHLLEHHAQRQENGTVVVHAYRLAGLDRYLIAEIFVALWHREGWSQRDMTARHYQALAQMTSTAADMAAPLPPAIELPGGIRAHIGERGTVLISPPVDDG